MLTKDEEKIFHENIKPQELHQLEQIFSEGKETLENPDIYDFGDVEEFITWYAYAAINNVANGRHQRVPSLKGTTYEYKMKVLKFVINQELEYIRPIYKKIEDNNINNSNCSTIDITDLATNNEKIVLLLYARMNGWTPSLPKLSKNNSFDTSDLDPKALKFTYNETDKLDLAKNMKTIDEKMSVYFMETMNENF